MRLLKVSIMPVDKLFEMTPRQLSPQCGDFSKWLVAGRPVPRRTVFIKGNHEDFAWLDAQNNPEVLPGLIYLRNGHKIELEGSGRETVCVGGVGGCYGPSDYGRNSKTLQGYARRHYTHDEVERLAASQGVDIVLTHDAPAGVCFHRNRHGAGYVSQAAGLDVVLARARPACASSVIITPALTPKSRG
jgi:hypothetical protein